MLQAIVTPELIDRVQQAFPVAPSRLMTQREIDHWIGQQEVIAYLKRLLEQQSDEPLDLENL
ncbi:MAG: hypothetical protein EBR34_14525 [Sphingomonadaceae bacterium]|nr:hypothetical protein [Sphingomonadaceae bacterium]